MIHTHDQLKTRTEARRAPSSRVALALAAALIAHMAAPPAYGFAADATDKVTNLKSHSSFHYEMTRTLAALAGFSKHEAEEIAVACEAADAGAFAGYPLSGGASITVTVTNTERAGPNNLFYHFARRSPDYLRADSAGAKANTCDYFVGGNQNVPTRAPCPSAVPELDQIRNWAFGLVGAKPEARRLPADAGGEQLRPQTPVALGVYLHSVGDSYSHESCMIEAAARTHRPSPFSCSGRWHFRPAGEFGAGAGVPFTRAAALEVWRALRRYRGEDASGEPPREAAGFIEGFTAQSDPCERVRYAVEAFNRLTGEATRITCSDGGRRRGGRPRSRG